MIARTDQLLPVPIGYAIEFDLDRPVASKKNGRRPWKRGNRVFLIPSAKAVADEQMVADAARAACGGVMPFGPDDALRIDYSHDVKTDLVHVRVTKVGVLPAKGPRGTKRDVFGMLETIADGMQDVLYPNDSAVDAGSFERRRT